MLIRRQPIDFLTFSCLSLWLVCSLLLGCATTHRETSSNSHQSKSAVTLAVWDFDNNAMEVDDFTYLSQALSESLLINLAQTPGIRILERVNLRKVLEEQHLGNNQLASEESRLILGRLAGVNNMVFGSFVAMGKQIRVDVRVVDTETSLVKFSEDSISPINEVIKQIPILAQHIAIKLSASANNGQGGSTEIALWKRYAEGITLMDKHLYEQAIAIFTALLKTDPHFAAAEKQLKLALEMQSRL